MPNRQHQLKDTSGNLSFVIWCSLCLTLMLSPSAPEVSRMKHQSFITFSPTVWHLVCRHIYVLELLKLLNIISLNICLIQERVVNKQIWSYTCTCTKINTRSAIAYLVNTIVASWQSYWSSDLGTFLVTKLEHACRHWSQNSLQLFIITEFIFAYLQDSFKQDGVQYAKCSCRIQLNIIFLILYAICSMGLVWKLI